MYEILDAIAQHNDDPETARVGDSIKVDVLTGASAGGMTAAILAQKLLFAKDEFQGPYDNPLYNTWVKGISLAGLLATVDKPIEEGGDPAELSVLSSQLIERISAQTLGQCVDGKIPDCGGAHNAIDPDRELQLGLALTNLNGVNYGYELFGGGKFQYTDFSDQMLRRFKADDPSCAPWAEIQEAAVACGAFPIAFRTKDLPRLRKDYLPSDTLEDWPSDPYTFTYTDGGVLQNQPLGMAKNLVDLNDNHLGNDNRFYLFVSPSPMEGKQDLSIREESADMVQVAKRLVDVYMGQSTFRDWIEAKGVNDQIDILDQRAAGLADALEKGSIDADCLRKASDQILDLLYPGNPDPSANPDRPKALARLRIQYADEVGALAKLAPPKDAAFLSAILALEKAANLGERDKMVIYGIVTADGNLAGAGFFAFEGFFDQKFRDHDYDWGRTVARTLLQDPKFGHPGQLGPIRYTPTQPIREVDKTLNGLPLTRIGKPDVTTFKEGVVARLNQVLDDVIPDNLVERYAAKAGGHILLDCLVEKEFS
jgi:hypothetical protein